MGLQGAMCAPMEPASVVSLIPRCPELQVVMLSLFAESGKAAVGRAELSSFQFWLSDC